jgi:KipI family sensor histidine kinase inhibitor
MIAPRILALGEAALSVEFGDRIDESLNARVHALDAALAEAPLPGQVETVPSYRALLVVFDPELADLPSARTRLAAIASDLPVEIRAARLWRVPVLYGGEAGLDLEMLADHAGLDARTYMARHAAGRYRIHMIGFQPGFCYLGGLDPALEMPRRMEPRLAIPSRSISVGGVQTAIGTAAGPSGWHVIGRTPVRSFHPGRAPAFLFAPGDEIIFHPIEADAWDTLDADAAAGDPVAERLA